LYGECGYEDALTINPGLDTDEFHALAALFPQKQRTVAGGRLSRPQSWSGKSGEERSPRRCQM